MPRMLTPLLAAENLTRHFSSGIIKRRRFTAVDGVSFTVNRGETLAIVGESGSGKTTLGKLLLRLLRPSRGRVLYKGRDLASFDKNLRSLRRAMQIIFQDADGSLNPRLRVRELLLEPCRVQDLNSIPEDSRLENLMGMVNLTPDLLLRYPHELSGGQRQRVGIARAMSLNPEFIVADEPAASLDRSVQAQILGLMREIQVRKKVSYLYISHDIRTIRIMAHVIAVMYRGRFVEYGQASDIFSNPTHPYTRLLLSSFPGQAGRETEKEVKPASGFIKSASAFRGCRFLSRCTRVENQCFQKPPEKKQIGDSHWVWCPFASGTLKNAGGNARDFRALPIALNGTDGGHPQIGAIEDVGFRQSRQQERF